MPRRDGTGPLGEGPMTGRAAGYCAGYDIPASGVRTGGGLGLGRGWGRGLGLGRGLGRGLGLALGLGLAGEAGRSYRNRFCDQDRTVTEEALSTDEEVSLLKSESQRLKTVLDRIDRRLSKLDTDKK